MIDQLKRFVFGAPDLPKQVIQNLWDSDVMIDVGANVGVYALAAPCRVYAIEPVPSTFIQLEENTRGVENISIHNTAFSEVVGPKTIYLYDDNGHNSMDEKMVAHRQNTPKGDMTIQCSTLDNFVTLHDIEPTFIKIDVEGHEREVLEGAQATISKYHPRILIETSPERADPLILPHTYHSQQIDRLNWLYEPCIESVCAEHD